VDVKSFAHYTSAIVESIPHPRDGWFVTKVYIDLKFGWIINPYLSGR
jgi:hypothetical protein